MITNKSLYGSLVEAYTFMKDLDLNYRILYSHGADRLYKVDTSHEWKQHISKIDKLKGLLKKAKE